MCNDYIIRLQYVTGTLLSTFLTVILAFATAYLSSRGTLKNERPRRFLPYALYLRCPLLIFDFAWTIVGTIWMLYDSHKCSSSLLSAVKTTVIGNWCVLLLFAIFIYAMSRQETRREVDAARPNTRTENCLGTCYRYGARSKSTFNAFEAETALNDVALLLSSYFNETDLVFTDVLAGMILLDEQDSKNPQFLRPNSRPAKCPDWMNLRLASRYIDFAAGSYGWPHYSAAYGPPGLCRLCGQMKFPPWNKPGKPESEILLDNCCYCNTAVMMQMTKAYQPEIVYSTYHNAIYQIPYTVLLDHSTKSVVVVVRGSLTLEDWVTDLSVVGMFYEIPSVDGHQKIRIKGHKGFFEAGKYIKDQLITLKILEKCFVSYPDYDLVVTGQSLGAGVAPALALYLREFYPKVRCFAFSPPGCVVSQDSVEFTETTVCTVVVGFDMVAHMSLKSLSKIQQKLEDLVHNCDMPKYQILRLGCIQFCAKKKLPPSLPLPPAQNETEMVAENGTHSPRSRDSTQETALTIEKIEFSPELHGEDLCLPGKASQFSPGFLPIKASSFFPGRASQLFPGILSIKLWTL